MANSHSDLSGSQPGRLSLSRRHSSKPPEASQSLSEGSGSNRTGAHRPQRHIVGGAHNRLGARNTSIGKNLNKLAKATAAAHDGAQASKNYTTSRFGDMSLPSSPRSAHAIKRHSSAFPMPRNTSHSALRKNQSSGHLPRHGSSKSITKTTRGHTRRNRSQQSDQSQHSQPPSSEPPETPQPPMVRFDLGDEETQARGEEEWTEASASQSPHTSRSHSASHTRVNSIADDGYVNPAGEAGSQRIQIPSEGKEVLISQSFSSFTSSIAERLVLTNGRTRGAEASQMNVPAIMRQSPTPRTRDLPDRARDIIQQINGSSSYHQFRPPDADAITSRILQKHNAAPQVSPVTARATADPQHPASLSHSQGSTFGDGTPGRDLVSRFINGSGGSAGGTPAEDSYLKLRQRRDEGTRQDDQNELEVGKRNKSAPSVDKVANQRRAFSARSVSGRSNPTELPPSRTAQKLLLQRASSAIEPGKHIPAVLPTRPGAPQLLGAGISFGESGPMPAQVQGLFNQTSKEYDVVRRFRNPPAEAISRLGETSIPRQQYINRPKNSKPTPNSPDGSLNQTFRERDAVPHRHHTSALSQGHATTRNKGEEQSRALTHRARVSFDLPHRPRPLDAEDVDEEQMESFGNDTGRVRNDPAYDLCRQMWELDYGGDVGGADAG